VFDAGPKRDGGAAKVSPAARVNGCWATRPLARAGLTKQTARHEKGWPLAGFGLAAAGDRATGGVAGVAGAGELDSHSRVKEPESWYGDARADARAHAHASVRRGAGSGVLGRASGRLADRAGCGSAHNDAKHGRNPRTSYGEMAPGEPGDQERRRLWHAARRVCRNGPVEPVHRCAGVRGGSTVARHATGRRGPRERRSSGDARVERRWRHLQEIVPA
jgi:hypothetical protein